MSSLYEPLPSHIQHNLVRLDLQELECPANKYVQTFINKQLPENMNKDQVMTTVKQKGVMLDAINMAERKKKRKRIKTMNARERRKRGIFKISKENQRYDLFLPLHEMWKQYINETLGNLNSSQPVNLKSVSPKLVKADYHGAIITVSKSKCPGYVGLSGILLQETKNVFKIITKQDEIKTVPKANSVFTVDIEGYLCTLYGNQLRIRSAERSSKKFKTKPTTDL
ncbi:Ribonuclease P subunit p29 [Paramuricea clavata]|uniref:Ribonuclease P protein subunit p29 n=1 Tax=Paramuricea clavata TaxID=317549 RepID=A0A6S7GZQ9_PARCT|nr:Ribonuclease P subunit p29 [Paramuricea clavata]